MENKLTQTKSEIHALIKKRWSPRAFSERAVEREKLERIFEAARWSASCFNEQPWRFIMGIKGENDTYEKIFNTLAEGNQIWCTSAPVLIVLLAKKTFSHNGKVNRWAIYDLGQAAAYISFQAMAEQLYVHQMAGFDPEKARQLFDVPQDFEPFTVMALGYIGDPQILPENLRKRELSRRERKPLDQLVFSDEWGKSAFNGK